MGRNSQVGTEAVSLMIDGVEAVAFYRTPSTVGATPRTIRIEPSLARLPIVYPPTIALWGTRFVRDGDTSTYHAARPVV